MYNILVLVKDQVTKCTGCTNKKQLPTKNFCISAMVVWIWAKLSDVSVHSTYPANFVKTTDMVQRTKVQVSVAEWLARLTAVWEDPGSNHATDSCVYRDSCCDIVLSRDGWIMREKFANYAQRFYRLCAHFLPIMRKLCALFANYAQRF